MKNNTKTVDLTNAVKNDSEFVEGVIANLQEEKTRTYSGDNSVYNFIRKEFSKDTRLTKEQLDLFESFETAMGIFKASTTAIRDELGINTLDELYGVKKQTYDQLLGLVKDVAGNSEVPISFLNVKPLKNREQAFNDLLAEFDTTSKQYKETQEKNLANKSKSENPEKISDLEAVMKDIATTLKDVNSLKFYSNKQALAFAGYVGLALMDEKPLEADNLFSLGNIDDYISTNSDKLVNNVVQTVREKLETSMAKKPQEKSKQHDFLKRLFVNVYTSWINQYDHKVFEDLLPKDKINGLKQTFNNFSFEAGNFRKQNTEIKITGNIMQNLRRDDLIGGREYEDIIWDHFMALSCYKFDIGKNAANPPSSILTTGFPGGGKTFTYNAMAMEFAYFCKQEGIPVWFLTHNITDFGSKYQNESPNRLMYEFFMPIKDYPGLVVPYMPDVDAIAPSRAGEMSNEERKTQSVYFMGLDHSIIPDTGRVMFFLDSNNLTSADKAFIDRVAVEQLTLGTFDKPEQFAEYMRRGILRQAGLEKEDDINIDAKKMNQIGDYILNETSLSLRSLGHIVDGIDDFKVTEKFRHMTYDKQIQTRRNHILDKVSFDYLMNALQNYVATRQKIEENNWLDKKDQDLRVYKEEIQKNYKPNTNG